ncbi:hypothetical protein ACA351_04960 [Orientia tsutsugamushi]|uniref:hypothetical protein n=1 Tax=Orientia tsutsugamushi TaxID=784 RepID=UPI00352804DE
MASISLKFTNLALSKIKTLEGKTVLICSDEVVKGLRARKSSSGRVTLCLEQK